jgi:NADH:ubiquinone oxidoreductase subunit 5 (subunit L)/multisubunit Na+/H+ antiporter MnhA subunit
MKAFAFNKVSDIFLLFFIIVLAHQTGTLTLTNWYTYYLINTNYDNSYFFLPTIFLIFASSIKSAQIIGHL